MAQQGQPPTDWNFIEERYQDIAAAIHQHEDEKIQKELEDEMVASELRLVDLYNERHKLTVKLRAIQEATEREEKHLKETEEEYDMRCNGLKDDRTAHSQVMTDFFATRRQEDSHPEGLSNGPPKSANGFTSANGGGNRTASASADEDTDMAEATDSDHGTSEFTGAKLCDGNGGLIGTIRRLNYRNQWIDKLLELPIKRHIKVRIGRRFTTANLDMIYKATDTKGAKWIACMIQATGEVRAGKCATCAKNSGVFDECVIVGGALFPRCGNCEWNRQSCHGAAATILDGDTEDVEMEPSESRRQSIGNASSNEATTPAAQMMTMARSRESSENSTDAEDGDDYTREITRADLVLRHDGTVYTEPECMAGVPVEKIDENHPYWDPSWQDIRPAVVAAHKKWKDKHDMLLRANASKHNRFQIGRQVNRGDSILKFLDTAELSPYQIIGKRWVSNGIIAYDTLFRFVNTLEELLKFRLDVTPLEWIRQRLHELIQIKGENFNLSKTLHDFYHDKKLSYLRRKNGFGNIGRPSGMRMSGPRGGGGPGGQSGGPGGPGGPPGGGPQGGGPPGGGPGGPGGGFPRGGPPSTGTTPVAARKRKSAHSTPATTPAGSPAVRARPGSSSFTAANSVSHDDDFVLNTGPKRRRFSDESYNLDDHTDYDSYSEDVVSSWDFRVQQIKTRFRTTNPHVTQYWHWADDVFFETQVLSDVTVDKRSGKKKVDWGTFQEPLNFDLVPEEIMHIMYAPDSLRVVVSMRDGEVIAPQDGKERGDVMALFKRQRTKRRFLTFCKEKGIKLVKDIEYVGLFSSPFLSYSSSSSLFFYFFYFLKKKFFLSHRISLTVLASGQMSTMPGRLSSPRCWSQTTRSERSSVG
jgi:hypothetical protein